MELQTASHLLATLGHPARLSVLRHLLARYPDGARPTDIIMALDLKPSTLSAHLAALEKCDLISATRQGTAINYAAHPDAMNALINYLTQDCCNGNPEFCRPTQGKTSKDTP